jgi:acyl-CoA reductase-like NAD-dependent aldehyde dehydrogenase
MDLIMSYQSTNSFDGRTLKIFENMTDEHLDAAPITATTCFEIWRHTPHAERAKVVTEAGEVGAGMMFINCIDWSDAELPFGGINDFSYGRGLGDKGIQKFISKKLVHVVSMDALA